MNGCGGSVGAGDTRTCGPCRPTSRHVASQVSLHPLVIHLTTWHWRCKTTENSRPVSFLHSEHTPSTSLAAPPIESAMPPLQVSLHPLVIHLTYNLALALQDYFQLTRDDGAAGDDASVSGTPGDAKQPSRLEPGDRFQHGVTGGPAGAAATAAEKMAAKLGRRRDEVRQNREVRVVELSGCKAGEVSGGGQVGRGSACC